MTTSIPASGISEDQVQEMYGTKSMRWYQIAAKNQAIASIKQGHNRILIVQPTGSGKTLTIAATVGSQEMKKALNIKQDRPIKVLFVAHKHRLLSQAEELFAVENGVELMLQSMMSDISEEHIKKGWDITVLDEAHHEGCASFQYQLEKIGEFPLIGLTATPDRADGMLIKFDVIINPISREQAVDEGFLAPTHIHTFVDVISKQKIDVLKDIFENYADQMNQTMVFVRTKNEVSALADLLNNMGYTAIPVLNQSDKELDIILTDFSNKKIQFIINCNKISEGVDVKGCTDVVLGRTVGSYPLLNQIIGRAARPDSPCNVWELINPLSGRNLDTTVVVGTPESHRLVSKECGEWTERQFNYVTTPTNSTLGMANVVRY